ncbi:MAG: RIP metalloprotease RseP [Burkholderiales bacterium]|nr:RIP metalloprotease RseP [Burkholderiales bacterium]
MMNTILAFLLALTVVIFVHEYGHYRAALWFKVRVLRFSIGFGKPLLRWTRLQPGLNLPTEFTVCALPLGGFIKMLDERDQEVTPSETQNAFNRQSLWARSCIVAAGPLANLLFTLFLYALVQWVGTQQAAAIIATPATGSIAESAGLRSGDLVRKFSIQADEWQAVQSMEHLKWLIDMAVHERNNFELEVTSPPRDAPRATAILVADVKDDTTVSGMARLGMTGAYSKPYIVKVLKEGPAAKAGLSEGDLVLKIDGRMVNDAQHVIQLIRSASAVQVWEIQRADGKTLMLSMLPDVREVDGRRISKIDAVLGRDAEMVWVQHGFVGGMNIAFNTLLLQSKMTFIAVGKLITTNSGWQQLSGPLTMAEYAGKTAEQGWRSFVQFVALISLSVGLLNLLPIPMLDGGHLMYYLWESVTGSAPSQEWLERLQVMGISMVALMMFAALFNDVLRWLT